MTAVQHSRHEPETDCRPEPPCVVTDIPKRAIGVLWLSNLKLQKALDKSSGRILK